MGEFKFSCTRCGQRIQADEQWSGQQIQCPSCQNELTVPRLSVAPSPIPAAPPQAPQSAPPPQPAPQIRFSAPPPPQQHSATRPQSPSRSLPSRKPLPPRKPEKKGVGIMVLKIGVTVVALAVGFYFGFGWISGMQEKTNAKRRQIEKQSDGGQVGHIAELYDFLDKTDPNRYSRGGTRETNSESMPRVRLRSKNPNAAGGDEAEGQPVEKELPVIPATWTLDLNAAQIPEGRANGKISGTNFVVDSARVDVVGGAYVLSLRQGAITSPDRQVLIYLRLKAGETLPGHTWIVSKEMKGTGVPQVAKLWKTDPRYAPQKKNFATGYAMKLEFGQINEEGIIPGKIFIALPDTEQSVVAGVFKAETELADYGNTPATARPGQSKPPMAGQVTPEERAGVAY